MVPENCPHNNQRPPRGPENWCHAKLVKKCRKLCLTLFDDFRRFSAMKQKGPVQETPRNPAISSQKVADFE